MKTMDCYRKKPYHCLLTVVIFEPLLIQVHGNTLNHFILEASQRDCHHATLGMVYKCTTEGMDGQDSCRFVQSILQVVPVTHQLKSAIFISDISEKFVSIFVCGKGLLPQQQDMFGAELL